MKIHNWILRLIKNQFPFPASELFITLHQTRTDNVSWMFIYNPECQTHYQLNSVLLPRGWQSDKRNINCKRLKYFFFNSCKEQIQNNFRFRISLLHGHFICIIKKHQKINNTQTVNNKNFFFVFSKTEDTDFSHELYHFYIHIEQNTNSFQENQITADLRNNDNRSISTWFC